MKPRLLFVISPPRSGSTLLQRMLGSHSEISTHPEPHLVTPLAYLGYHDRVDAAPYDHINAAEAIRSFVTDLPHGEQDYLDALRAYADTLYGRSLERSGCTFFMDKTPAYTLVLPFLTKLYPDASYVVLTRHPLAVMSSYANSFFDGDWKAANRYNSIVSRYVPAIASLLREQPVDLVHVAYEKLVTEPAAELARVFAYLKLEHDPDTVDYGRRFRAKAGMGDPIGVHQHQRPVPTSIDKWVTELEADPAKRQLAEELAARLAPEDLALWGYTAEQLFEPLQRAGVRSRLRVRPKLNSYVFQRRVLLALRKQMRREPVGKAVRRVRYACDVLLRDSL